MNKEKIIVALDVDSTKKAVELVIKLKDDVGAFKVGLELVNAAGLEVIQAVQEAGAAKVFYDCKFHDIPNTVSGASKAAAKMGVWMFNVHASGGSAMMKSARDAADSVALPSGAQRPLVIAVTLLTSIDQSTLCNELGVTGTVQDHIRRMAVLAKEAGLDGVVASPHEVSVIREACGPDFIIVTPGVRPVGADIGDQKRVMTPIDAINAGSDYLVIGRPVTKAANPCLAARAIAKSLD